LQGVLAQAKIGEELFWEEKFHAANGKAQSMHSKVHCLFFSKILGGEEEVFYFIFSLVPQCVPITPFNFPMGSHDVP
jgi:hypothetical protein